MNRIERARITRDYISDYIKFADAKAGALLAVGAAAIAGLSTLAGASVEKLLKVPVPFQILLALVVIGTVSAAVTFGHYCVEALRPRIDTSLRSRIAFPDIASNPRSFVDFCSECDDVGFAAEVDAHSVVLAHIANAKYTDIGRAIYWLRWTMLGAFAALLFFTVLRGLNWA